jgi:hypothetical protein
VLIVKERRPLALDALLIVTAPVLADATPMRSNTDMSNEIAKAEALRTASLFQQ